MFYYGWSTLGGAEPPNQDIYAAYEAPDGLIILILADGVSGSPAGEVAANLAVNMFTQVIDEHRDKMPLNQLMMRAVQAANDWVRLNADRPPGKKGMATCFTAVAVTPEQHLVVTHVGSSRVYVIRDEQIVQLTEDHTRAWQEMKKGLFTRRQIRYHPDRLVLTRALGVWEEVEVDTLEARVYPGDIIALLSDGVIEAFEDDEALKKTILAAGGTQAAVETLLDTADLVKSGNATAFIGFIPPKKKRGNRKDELL